MFGRSSSYSHSLAARDRKIAALRTRLSLATVARNKPEVTRITASLKQLGTSY